MPTESISQGKKKGREVANDNFPAFFVRASNPVQLKTYTAVTVRRSRSGIQASHHLCFAILDVDRHGVKYFVRKKIAFRLRQNRDVLRG